MEDTQTQELVRTESADKTETILKAMEALGKTKLCGYLNKLGNRSIMKLYKSRWFVYGEDACKLYYYRNPQDLIPLGEIDLSLATFYFDAESSEKPGLFEIRTDGRTYFLEAPDKQTMMYWLQELQERRRKFSQKKTKLFSQSKNKPIRLELQSSLESSNETSQNRDTDLITPVLPTEEVGEGAAKRKSGGVMNISMSNLRTELRNAFLGIRSNRQSTLTEIGTSPIGSPVVEQRAIPGQQTQQGQDKPRTGIRKQSRDAQTNHRRSESPTISCQKCQQLQQLMLSAKDDQQIAEEELMATREIVKLLQRHIDKQQKEIKLQEIIESGSEMEDLIRLIKDKDKEIIDLQNLLAMIQEEIEQGKRDNLSKDTDICSLNEQVTMLREMVMVKDQNIMALTNKIFEIESGSGSTVNTSTNTTLRPIPPIVDITEINKLKDNVSAFTQQNKFLSKEILELNKLRTDDLARENMQAIQYTELEAKFYQMKSKHLLLLNELRKPVLEYRNSGSRSQENSDLDLVSRLVQDALDSNVTKERDLTHGIQPYLQETQFDRYGFIRDYIDDDEFLVVEAERLNQKSGQVKAQEISVNVKWENYLASLNTGEILKTAELKHLVRQGVPQEYRERIWIACTNFQVSRVREKLGVKYYQNLLNRNSSKKKLQFNPVIKQIELDLLRTLPNNRHYQKLDSDGVPRLRNILQAFSWHNPTIGYCQGMNRLAAMALLFLKEEEAFWCLVAIVENIMPHDYYSNTLLSAHADQRVLKDLIADKLPRLHTHMEGLDIDLSLFTFNWFLTVFVDNTPVETFLRIWDCFLYEGSKVLFRYAGAIFKCSEEEMLKQGDSMSINNYLRSIGSNIRDVDKLTQIAFNELNPLPMKYIRQKRDFHYQKVQAELRELDALRQDYQSHQVTSDNKIDEDD